MTKNDCNRSGLPVQAPPVDLKSLQPLFYNNQPVITSNLLSEVYSTDVLNIRQNHKRNRVRFEERKHFFMLKGKELKGFKMRVTESHSHTALPEKSSSLTLWTARGAARHAKILDTDQAWEVFELLEDHYFSNKWLPEEYHQPPVSFRLLLSYEFGKPVSKRIVPNDCYVFRHEDIDKILVGFGQVAVNKTAYDSLVDTVSQLRH